MTLNAGSGVVSNPPRYVQTRWGMFDRDLEMYCVEPHDPDFGQLLWLRKIAEQEVAGKRTAQGPSSGEYVQKVMDACTERVPRVADAWDGANPDVVAEVL